jgi:hypothetical protein
MHAFITIAAMAAIFAAHVAVMVELRPRGARTRQENQETISGEAP